MAGLSQGSEAAVAASPKPAVAASPEDLASLRVSQPLKLSNVPLKWIRDSCEDPRGTPTTDCVVLSQGSEPAVAESPKPAVAGSPEDLASQGVVGSVSSGEGFVLWKWWKLVYYILVCQRPRGRSFLCVPSPKPPPGPPWEAGDSDAED